jgi:hypothetical protein
MTRVRSARHAVAALAVTAAAWFSADAHADAPSPKGLAVMAQGDATVSAWTLARAVYGDTALLPATLDETHARALLGEQVAPDAPRDVRDLAETRAALHGDDAPSRSLLSGIAASLHVRGIVVVEEHQVSPSQPRATPAARVFVAGTGAFDAVLYEPDPPPTATWGSTPPSTSWLSATNALRRSFGEAGVVIPGPSSAPSASGSLGSSAPLQTAHPAPPEGEKKHPFYTSPWFWGALGAAAFAGVAFYFVTRDSSDPMIQLQVQVPK